MVGVKCKRVAAAALLLALAGCGGVPNGGDDGYGTPAPSGRPSATTEDGNPLQCVPYARDRSGIKIHGDAYTWWDKAAGSYERAYAPQEGAVMVLYNYAGPRHSHVAVVKRIVSSREIRIDHANWLNDGAIYDNDPVRDVSPDNDWSEVQVYNIPADNWGSRIYPVQGFILPQTPERDGDLLLAKIQETLAAADDDADAVDDEDEYGAGANN